MELTRMSRHASSYLVEQGCGLFRSQVRLVDYAELQLDDAHRGIVDDADELWLDAFIHKTLVSHLQRPDSLNFDKNLVGN